MNQITIYGHLGQDPEIKDFNGQSVTEFSVATSRKYKAKDGESKKITTWHNIIAWGKRGEAIAKWFYKGDPILLTGRLDMKKYQDNEGVDRLWVEINLENFSFVHNPNDDSKKNNVKVKGNNNVTAGRDIQNKSVDTNPQYKKYDIPF